VTVDADLEGRRRVDAARGERFRIVAIESMMDAEALVPRDVDG
jgi:hypothetical protein